jgi:hypothetical protein
LLRQGVRHGCNRGKSNGGHHDKCTAEHLRT